MALPVYTYRCPNGHETQVARRPEDADRSTRCAECGAICQRLVRLRGVDDRPRRD